MDGYISAQCAARSLGPANQLVNLLIQTLITSYCSISETGMWPGTCPEVGTIGGKARAFVSKSDKILCENAIITSPKITNNPIFQTFSNDQRGMITLLLVPGRLDQLLLAV